MKLKVETDSANELILTTNEETILNPIKNILTKDETITFAAFNRTHPQKDEIRMVVRGKNPKTSLKKAVKTFITELKELSKQF